MTEQLYIKDLLTLQMVWEKPLTKEKALKVKQEWLDDLFGNLEQVITTNVGFYKALYYWLESEIKDKTLGDILIQYMPFFQNYGDYVSGYDKAIYTFEKMMKQPALQKWFSNIQANEPLAKGLNFDAFLIKPVQRVPRYKLFIDRLLKCTPQDDPDFPKLPAALEKCDKIAHVINSAKEKQIQREFMSKIAEKIDCGNELLMIPGRSFVKDIQIDKITRKSKRQPRHLFLFTDVLMVATDTLTERCVVQVKLQLKGSEVKDLPDDVENGFLNRFQFLSYPKSLELAAASKEEKDKWMELLLARIQEADKSLGSKIKVIPMFEPDAKVKRCPICSEKFTAVFRKHHCRQCRRVVCGNCTKHKRKLPSQSEGERKKRVCDDCWKHDEHWTPEGATSDAPYVSSSDEE
uniref:Uncharacterized protein n=1 Tax=Arcella intermedia TaxID=1963864 RepID=A0A6B2L4J4_9EUKA